MRWPLGWTWTYMSKPHRTQEEEAMCAMSSLPTVCQLFGIHEKTTLIIVFWGASMTIVVFDFSVRQLRQHVGPQRHFAIVHFILHWSQSRGTLYRRIDCWCLNVIRLFRWRYWTHCISSRRMPLGCVQETLTNMRTISITPIENGEETWEMFGLSLMARFGLASRGLQLYKLSC